MTLASFQGIYGGTIMPQGSAFRFVSIPQSGAYAASATLPQMPTAGTTSIRCRIEVLRGTVGLGLLDDDAKQFIAEQNVDRSAGARDVYLDTDRIQDGERLIVRNGGTKGAPTEVLVYGIDIVSSGLAQQAHE